MKTRPPQRTHGPARPGAAASLFPEIPHAKQRAMPAALAHCLSVTTACAQVGIARETHYQWVRQSPAYAAALATAKQLGADWLEDMAIQRATAGEHPSDTLLMFLLKGAKPEQYRDSIKRDERSEVSELLKAVLLELVDRGPVRGGGHVPAAAWAPLPPGPPALPPPPGLDDAEAR